MAHSPNNFPHLLAAHKQAQAEANHLRAENEELRAENSRLQAAAQNRNRTKTKADGEES